MNMLKIMGFMLCIMTILVIAGCRCPFAKCNKTKEQDSVTNADQQKCKKCQLLKTGTDSSKLTKVIISARSGSVPSDMPKITKEEILARFPIEKHNEFMRQAIANSYKAGVKYKTGGAFGAVIVDKNGTIIANGLNHVVAQNDPTWHAEMHAIRQACALLKTPKLKGCILYTSSEPCPMCLATIYWAGLDGVFYSATVADSKKYGNFDDDFIYEQFRKKTKDRAISEQILLRPEAVEVWKKYSEREDKVDY